jgi:hypothetical protein
MNTAQLSPPNQKEITSRLALAKEALRDLIAAEHGLRESAENIHRRAWILGAHLFELKEEIGHGKWMTWLPSNFRELGSTDEMRYHNAWRCINFYKGNPSKFGNSQTLRPPKEFSIDSVRKLMWGYIPAKERPELPGNEDVSPQPHYLTFINNYSKFRRQVALGRATVPSMRIMHRDFEPTVRDMIELLGRDWFYGLLKS